MERQDVERFLSEAGSNAEAAKNAGVHYGTFRRLMIKYNIPRKKPKRSREDIISAIRSTNSMLEASKVLNMSFTNFIRYANKYEIYAPNQGRKGIRRDDSEFEWATPLEDILSGLHPFYTRGTLKKRLLRKGIIKNQCDICGITEWMGSGITCQLDHIDGNPHNHRLENLRMICPNCHSQTETYGNKINRENKRRQIRTCSDEEFTMAVQESYSFTELKERLGTNGGPNKSYKNRIIRLGLQLGNVFPVKTEPNEELLMKSRKRNSSNKEVPEVTWIPYEKKEYKRRKNRKYISATKRTSPGQGKKKAKSPYGKKGPRPHKRLVERPPYEQLLEEIRNLGYCAVGRKYGVSDKAIYKWIRVYEFTMKVESELSQKNQDNLNQIESQPSLVAQR